MEILASRSILRPTGVETELVTSEYTLLRRIVALSSDHVVTQIPAGEVVEGPATPGMTGIVEITYKGHIMRVFALDLQEGGRTGVRPMNGSPHRELPAMSASRMYRSAVKPADQIRDYAYRTYIKPARDRGQEIVRIRCGDVHKALGFVNRNSMVCTALGTKKFRREQAMELVETEGSFLSPELIYMFRLLPG